MRFKQRALLVPALKPYKERPYKEKPVRTTKEDPSDRSQTTDNAVKHKEEMTIELR